MKRIDCRKIKIGECASTYFQDMAVFCRIDESRPYTKYVFKHKVGGELNHYENGKVYPAENSVLDLFEIEGLME